MPRIVHLEDDGPLCELTRTALEFTAPHVELVQYKNSDKLLAYIKANHREVDGYIFDIRVIGTMTGFELAQRMRKAGIATPIVLTSAYLKPPRDEMEKYNLEWLAKPANLFDLQKWVLKHARKS
ncbi:MAG: hypothetical protein AAFV33_20150 [Chloroflexota bacterium]